jgi:hypothetical protein
MIHDPRLLELIDAAEKLITEGGSVTNRRSLTPTPTVTAVLQRAVELANASNDLNLRSHHLQFALEEITQQTTPK